MKLKSNIQIPAFLQAVQACKGEVNFVTAEGDNLNLKSTLSQFVFTAVIAGKLQSLQGQVILQNPDDQAILQDYCEQEA